MSLNGIFARPYDYETMNELSDEREALAMAELIKAFAKDRTPEQFVCTLMLATAACVQATCFNEESACIVAGHAGRYMHEAVHAMYEGEPPANVPTPTVPHTGTA